MAIRVLITGGAGFIGSNFIRYSLKNRPEWQIVNFDLLTYAGNLANLERIAENDNYRFVRGDISNLEDLNKVFESGFEYVINFAAESHVDRSLYDPSLFIKTNILGTQLLLNQAKISNVKRFLQISTDEVYGSLGRDGLFKEDWPLKPNSPYSASKASADLMCRAYHETFGMPVIITRSSNNYGQYQFPEKLIPFFITKAMNNEPLPLYGDGLNIRDWLYVEDNCGGILAALEKGIPGESYNIGGGNELTNLEITKIILRCLGKAENLIKFVKDRPGHDRRYALDISKANSELGWKPSMDFRAGIENTIKWYLANEKWWRDILSGDYRNFYDIHYRERR